MSSPRSVIRALIVNTTLALIPPFLLLALGEHPTAQRLRATLAYSLIYSNCIGTLAFATIPRIWMRTVGINRWLRWPLRIATMFAASVVGSLIAGLVFIALGWQSMDVYWKQFT